MQNSTQAANAWRILFLLFLANLFNFFDRTIPAIIIEPIRMEWSLSDFQIGIIGTAFTIVYAIAGLPLGRMADTGSRSKLMGWGLAAWSGLTAVNGLVGSFWAFLLVRMGVGIGEASYAPAANSLIGDLFPAHRRARAMGIFMLGLPLGLLLAFFTIGAMVKAFDSWRAPFFIAAVPGLVLAVFMFFIKGPSAARPKPCRCPRKRLISRFAGCWQFRPFSGWCWQGFASTSRLMPATRSWCRCCSVISGCRCTRRPWPPASWSA